jgi:hypothetical protein
VRYVKPVLCAGKKRQNMSSLPIARTLTPGAQNSINFEGSNSGNSRQEHGK